MKHAALLLLISLYSIQQSQVQLEWNNESYALANAMQQQAALTILEESGMNIDGKRVLDIGSGVGDISAAMATRADKVCGIDPSANMIRYSKENYEDNNLFFVQSTIEEFETQEKYDCATAFYSYHWIKDKQKALENINASLGMGGEIIITFISASGTSLLKARVFQQTFPLLSRILTQLKQINITLPTSYSCQTSEEFKTAVADAGFVIMSFEHTPMSFVGTKEMLKRQQYTCLANLSIMKIFPESVVMHYFDEYFENLIKELSVDPLSGNYIYPLLNNHVLYAKKIKELDRQYVA